MKRVSVFIAIFILIFPILGFCKNKEKERIERCIWLVSEIMKEDAPRYLLSHSKGVVIIPGIKKAAFIFGAKRGKGVIVLRKNGKWLPPFFITLSGGSFGLQAGAKSSDILLIVMTERAVDTFRRNKMRLGVDIGITAGPVGKETGLSSEDLYKVDIYCYGKERGIFAGINLSGSIITHDREANRRFYGKEISFEDILKGRLKNIPAEAKKLLRTIEKYSKI